MDVVVGLQAGSEGKGKIVQHLAPRYDVAIRVGGHQAGHTVYYDGKPFPMRTIPCAWVSERPRLVIGPGAFFSLDVLERELRELDEAGVDVRSRLAIDPRATIVEERHAEAARGNDAFGRYGSTMQGVGVARIEKLQRTGSLTFAADVPRLEPYLADTIALVGAYVDRGDPVLLEGHQGSLLSIVTSPYYPKTTNADPNAAGILSDAAISPLAVRHVIGVFRTYPIRVAGRSGALSAPEITWEEVTRRSGSPVLICEMTTVTRRVRRVFDLGEEDLAHSIAINRPTKLALTFLDYWNHEDHGKTRADDLSPSTWERLRELEERLGVEGRIGYVSTGTAPETTIDLEQARTRLRPEAVVAQRA